MSPVLCVAPSRACTLQCFAQRGKNVKVNKRGKVTARPGPPSPRTGKKQTANSSSPAPAADLPAAQISPASDIPRSESPVAVGDAQPQAGPSPTTSPAATQDASPPAPAATSIPAPSNPVASSVRPRDAPAPPRETPQVVVDRIFVRMVACAGIPMATGVALLFVFYVLKKQGGDDFPVWPAYVSQAATLLGGLLGITYGALSASWDPSREGSFLGWTEFKANLPMFLSKKDGAQ